jgi:ABC-2 type transport system ATP-binding protein
MVCDRVAIIVSGRIRFEGATHEFLAGGEPEADVVLAGLPPETAASLEEDFRARLRGVAERIELRVAEKLVNPLLRAAITAGAEVVSVTPHRMSLESIFLSAVEEDRARRNRAGGEERT